VTGSFSQPARDSNEPKENRDEEETSVAAGLMRYNRDSDPAPPDRTRFLESDLLVPIGDRFRRWRGRAMNM